MQNFKTRSGYLRYAMPALALGATLSVAVPAQAGLLKGISEQEEIQAGQEVARQAEKEFGGALPANHPMSRRVRNIGNQFARLSQRRNIPYTYRVLNSDKVLNAFAAPGGPIYVTRKLVETAANDAELAYVLGHETAHIDRRHIVKQIEKQQKTSLGIGILGAILGGRGGKTFDLVANGWALVRQQKYSRRDENESDTVGVRWMSRLGYDPRAAAAMLGKLGGGGGGPQFLSSHPDPGKRQESVRALIAQENLLDVARRAGGPRLASSAGDGSYAGYDDAAYPPSASNGDPGYYPPSGDASSPRYPDEDTQPGYAASDAGSNELDFGAPLRVRVMSVAGQGNLGVVMAPVNGFARWAGATIARNGLTRVLRRGGFELELRENSTVAYVNRRAVTMTAPAITYDGKFYAPLGQLAEGLGARATLDERSRVVNLSLSGRQSGFLRLP